MSEKELDGGEAAAMYALELRKAQEHIAELEADLTRIREALAHNCDQSGCPSVGPHIVGDIPPHKASLYQETIRAQRELLAAAQTRIAELEEERVELQDALDEIATLLSCPPEYDREHLYIDAVAARDIAIKAIDGGPIDEARERTVRDE
jgi:DNA repair exonuclease SbcCD ATPase subunit